MGILRRGRQRRLLAIAGTAAIAVALLNVAAYHHAWAFTHFAAGGRRTAPPERLSWPSRARVLLTGATLPRPVNRSTPADVGLPYEVRRFPSADGLALEGWWLPREDARGTVVVFHGYADGKESLLGAGQEIHDLGYAVLLVDFRASGGSAGDDTSIGYHEAEDVLGALAHIASAPRPHVLYGVSMGAAAVLRAVGDRGATPDAILLQFPYDRLLTTARNRFRAVGVPSSPFAELLVFWGGFHQGFDGFDLNPVESATRVRVPALVLCGEKDARVRPEECRAVGEALGGEKRLEMFEGAAHESLLRAHRDRWRAVVAGFLKDLPQP